MITLEDKAEMDKERKIIQAITARTEAGELIWKTDFNGFYEIKGNGYDVVIYQCTDENDITSGITLEITLHNIWMDKDVLFSTEVDYIQHLYDTVVEHAQPKATRKIKHYRSYTDVLTELADLTTSV